ncbi:MAG: ATP-dependent Clp protease proteolytic subunit [Bacteroidales bacterium]
MNLGTINISNKADTAIIDIDGIIGVPEWWQFENPEDKVSTYDTFKSKLNEIKALKASNIHVNIQSPGGFLDHAFAIYETLKSTNAKISTKAYGFTASAATIIHQAAEPGERQMAEHSLYLIHRCSGMAEGNIHQMTEAFKSFEKVDIQIAELYASQSKTKKMTTDDYMAVMDRENGNGEWISADEAIELDLVDKKVSGSKITNMIDFKALNLPEYKPTKNEMKIKESWNQFINLLKVGKDTEITENHLESLNSELTNKATEVTTLTAQVSEKETKITELTNTVAAKDVTIGEKETKITELTNQLTTVTSERDQLKANKTETKDVEDPPQGEQVLTGNAAAYNKDMENFKD